MRKTRMNRLVAAAIAFACGLAVWAMPTREELMQAQELVKDLTADDVRAMKSGAKKPGEVAAAQVALADEAETEAGKYLLLQGAFKLYARNADYDAAADVLARMRKEIADLPPELVVELVNGEMRRVAADKAPKVLAIFRDAQRTIRCRKDLEVAENAVKAKPGNAAAQRRLAECHAGLGDWAKALEAFAKLGVEAAKFELDPASAKGCDASKAADFWWNYPTKDSEPFQVHAAVLYRKGLADGSISGLRKTLAEKRVKQMEDVMPASSSASTNEAAKQPLAKHAAPASAANGKEISVKLATGVTLDFVPCPAGSFEMGCSDDEKSPMFKHKVTITRPFWIGKYQVTRAVWNQFYPKEEHLHGLFDECGGLQAAKSKWYSYNHVLKFCEWLNKHRKTTLPKGYVFRLPTDAEWEYVLNANGGKPGNLYHRWRHGDKAVAPQIMVTGGDYTKLLGEKWEKSTKKWSFPSMTVGTKLPNDWGVYDMLGNGAEYVLDTYDSTVWTNGSMKVGISKSVGSRLYEGDETDPVHVCTDPKKACAILRGVVYRDAFTAHWWWKWADKTSIDCGTPTTFRLVIGPDLLKERGIKQPNPGK